MIRPTLAIDAGHHCTAVMLAVPGLESSSWPRAAYPAGAPAVSACDFLKTQHLPDPELTVLCHREPDGSAPGCKDRIARFRKKLLSAENFPASFFQKAESSPELSPILKDTIAAFGSVWTTDSAWAAMLAALSFTPLRERCWREGCTAIFAGTEHVQAFMLYREKVQGMYEHHTGRVSGILEEHLRQLRLNWLPDEEVRATGGHGCICGELPEEAEGFRPTFLFGPESSRFAGCGRMVSACGDPRFDRCSGLLWAAAGKENLG